MAASRFNQQFDEIDSDPDDGGSEPELGGSEIERGIPKSALNKLIKQVAPEARISHELRELLATCCTAFVHNVTKRADSIMATEHKRAVMTPECLIEALKAMGLGAYVDENVANSHKLRLIDDRKRRASARLENSGLSHEELLRRQQELLAEAAMDSFGCSEGANASLEALQDALQRSHSQPASNSPLLMPPPALPFALSVGAAPLSAQAPQPLPNACLLNNAQSQPALQPDEDYDS